MSIPGKHRVFPTLTLFKNITSQGRKGFYLEAEEDFSMKEIKQSLFRFHRILVRHQEDGLVVLILQPFSYGSVEGSGSRIRVSGEVDTKGVQISASQARSRTKRAAPIIPAWLPRLALTIGVSFNSLKA